MIGIYMYKNKLNNHCYIGQSINIQTRKWDHQSDYKNEKSSSYNCQFYQALRKYGIENFEFFILEECLKEDLDKKEIFYINKFDSFKNGYNATLGGGNLSVNLNNEEHIEKSKKILENINKNQKNEKHPRAKLSNEEVRQIRIKYLNGYCLNELWQDYKDKYNKNTFARIVRGQSYKTVEPVPTKEQIKNLKYGTRKFTVEQIKEIRLSKKTISELAKEFNVSYSCIENIIKRNSYKNID